MENNKSSKLDKVMKLSIIAGALVMALSVAYYLVIFLPNTEKNKLNLQQEKEKRLPDCLKSVELRYGEEIAGLNEFCENYPNQYSETAGTEIEELRKSCLQGRRRYLNNQYEEGKENCFNIYPKK